MADGAQPEREGTVRKRSRDRKAAAGDGAELGSGAPGAGSTTQSAQGVLLAPRATGDCSRARGWPFTAWLREPSGKHSPPQPAALFISEDLVAVFFSTQAEGV